MRIIGGYCRENAYSKGRRWAGGFNRVGSGTQLGTYMYLINSRGHISNRVQDFLFSSGKAHLHVWKVTQVQNVQRVDPAPATPPSVFGQH